MANFCLVLLSVLPLIFAAPTPPLVNLNPAPSPFVLTLLSVTSGLYLENNTANPNLSGPEVTVDFEFADPDTAYETSKCSTAWSWNEGPPYGRIIPCLGNTDMGFAFPAGSFNLTDSFSLVLTHYVADADAAQQLVDAAAVGDLTAYNQTQVLKLGYLNVTSALVSNNYNTSYQYPVSQSYQPQGNKIMVPISSVELSVLNALTATS